MDHPNSNLIREELKSPRAAAVAGIAFAVLYGGAILLIRLAVPTEIADSGVWMERYQGMVSASLTMVPFAGIAFLWFIGVLRDQLGQWEDRLFATVFLGSGLLLIAMLFISAALVGSLLTAYAANPDLLLASGVYLVNRAAAYQIINIYGIKMAGVFMLSLASIWLRTRLMPRWVVILTYGVALVLIIVITFNIWITLVFPAWVLVVSSYILAVTFRAPPAGQPEQSGQSA